jgi:hypothetical protein
MPTPHAHASPDSTQTTSAVSPPHPSGCSGDTSPHTARQGPPSRGLTDHLSTRILRERIQVTALETANRFRVIRTLDVAVACFPERPFKAALTAAQRAVAGLVKAGLLKRYKTERQQTVYGLTQRGAQWLEEQGIIAHASVRRVSEMRNPEHRLWAQFLAAAAQARGLTTWTEAELLEALNHRQPPLNGYLQVKVHRADHVEVKTLRPDAVAYLDNTSAVWIEVDLSKRSSDRLQDLQALVRSVGARLADGKALRQVALFAGNPRIAHNLLHNLQSWREAWAKQELIECRRHLREVSPGVFEVWGAVPQKFADGRIGQQRRVVGWVTLQPLPVELARHRQGRGDSALQPIWFDGSELPFRRAPGSPAWPELTSPLLLTGSSAQ